MSARTRKDYGIEDGFTGESLYDSLRRHLLGTHAQRLRVAAFEQFLGRTFFSGSDITIIPRHDADVVNVRIGSDPECNIYDLGDGVQHCIVLFAPLYFGDFDKTGLALFVEEPDLFLHPGYQRLWVRAILEWNDYPLQVFATTHSNHLLERASEGSDLSVFRVGKGAREAVECRQVSGRDRALLDYVGARNTSVFLSNCTIWVEGPTDRAYFRAYLSRVMTLSETDTWREDLHYSFVEYGGANIAHMFKSLDDGGYDPESFAGRCMVIVDKDDENSKTDRKQFLRDRLEDRFVILPTREVENLLTPHVVEGVARAYERNDDVRISTVSTRKWRMTPMGSLINTHLEGRKRKTYATSSGTLTDKMKFCERAVEVIRSGEFELVVSKDADAVARQILGFIRDTNGAP